MRIGIYAPGLKVYGGGEKFICKIAEISSERHNVDLINFEEIDRVELEHRLNVNLNNIKIRTIHFPSFFNKIHHNIKGLIKAYILSNITRNYDLFINQKHPSIISSFAKRSILICQVPFRQQNLLYDNPFTNLFFDPKLKTYNKIIVYSNYSKKWVKRWYKKKTIVLYPPIDIGQFSLHIKKNFILSVGRFFSGGHCKKQFEMIRTFKQMYDAHNILKNWEYHLVGGVSTKIEALKYLERCQKEAKGYPIYFHINVSFEVLKTFYDKSKIFWHATGLDEDENEHPERMEHFGITTGEAMSAGCVPVVINKGGQPEIVRNNIDGFLWNDIDELKKYTLKLVQDTNLWEKMSQSSIKRIQRKFSMNKFIEKTKQIFIEELK